LGTLKQPINNVMIEELYTRNR